MNKNGHPLIHYLTEWPDTALCFMDFLQFFMELGDGTAVALRKAKVERKQA